MSRLFPLLTILVGLFVGPGCIRIKSDPIHVIVDVNIRVEKELGDFFDDLDAADPTSKPSQKQP